NEGLPRREIPGVHFLSEPGRTHRQLEVASRDVREGELPIVAGNNLSIGGFILRREPDYRAHTHRSRLVEDCTDDGSRPGRWVALILRPLLRPIRGGRRKTVGRCLSGQQTAFDGPPSLRTPPRTANKQDQGKAKTQKYIRLRELCRPYQDCFTAAQNKIPRSQRSQLRDATIERRLQGIFAGQIAPT